MNLNKIIICGRLTKNPVLRTTQTGQSVASFSLATNRVWTDKSGKKQEQVEFHNCIVWGRQAETSSKFLVKGQECLVEGRIQTRGWEDKQGQKRQITEIIADMLQFGQKPRELAQIGNVSTSTKTPLNSSELSQIPSNERSSDDDLGF